MKNIFQQKFAVVWIAAIVLSVGLVTHLGADEHTQPNESGWIQTNGPYGGNISALHAAPKGVLFAGTRGGGIFRSTDRGDTWAPVNTGLSFEPGEGLSIRAFAHNSGTIYVGTADAWYASTNGGDTWSQIPIFRDPFVTVTDIIFIGARLYISTLNRGVWYSDNDGESWRSVPVTIGGRMYTFDLNGYRLYSDDRGSWQRPPAQNDRPEPIFVFQLSSIGTTLVAATQNKVFRQRTNEEALTAINEGSVEQPIKAFAAMDNLFFAGGSIDEKGSGLFRSEDEGDSWIRIATEEITRTVQSIAVYGATLYVGTSGGDVFRSDDKGASWTTVNDGLAHRRASTLLAVNEETVFAGTYGGGVFRTTDGGDSWVEINNGITNAEVSALEVVGNRLYAKVDRKIVYTADGGESWQPIKIPSTAMKYEFPSLSVSDDELYVGAVRYVPRGEDQRGNIGGIFKVDAENNTLIELVVDGNLAGLQCIEVVGSTFYIGTLDGGVFQWEKDLGPWPTNLGLEHRYITALSRNGERVYAGAKGDEIYRLKAGAWEPIHATDMMDDRLVELKWVGSTLYATFWNNGVFRSQDGGDSWTTINDGLDDTPATVIGTDGRAVYVGTFNGVFQWIEDKKQWQSVGSLPYQTLSLAVLDGFLYAGTSAGGVYKMRIVK